MNTTTDLTKLSTAELKAALAQREKMEKAEQQERRKKYEDDRDTMIVHMCGKAIIINEAMVEFKTDVMQKLPAFMDKMKEYGDLRKGNNNKGNFEIKTDDFKVIYSSTIIKGFDERSLMAEEKLKSWLKSFVRNRDKKLYDFIMSLLERNHITGDLDISNINRLYKLENDYEEQDWKDALRLFRESYNPKKTAYYARFYKKDENGAWKNIGLQFSAL